MSNVVVVKVPTSYRAVGKEHLARASVRECPRALSHARLAGLLTLQTDPIVAGFLPCAKGGRDQGHAASRTDRRALVIHV